MMDIVWMSHLLNYHFNIKTHEGLLIRNHGLLFRYYPWRIALEKNILAILLIIRSILYEK